MEVGLFRPPSAVVEVHSLHTEEEYLRPTILAPGLLAVTFVQAEQYRHDYTAPDIFC